MERRTYHITFTVKGKREYMAFIARSQEFAIDALLHIYDGMKVVILYVVRDDEPTEAL